MGSCLTVRSPWVHMTFSSLQCSFPVRTPAILSFLSFISFPSLYSPSPPLPTNSPPFSSILLFLHLLVVSSHSTHFIHTSHSTQSYQSYKFSHNSLPLGFYTSNSFSFPIFSSLPRLSLLPFLRPTCSPLLIFNKIPI